MVDPDRSISLVHFGTLSLCYKWILFFFKLHRLHKCPDISQPGDPMQTSHHALDGVELRGTRSFSALRSLLPADLLVVFQHPHHLVMSELHGVIDWQVPPPAQRGGEVMKTREISR